jgi:hypothetical protein
MTDDYQMQNGEKRRLATSRYSVKRGRGRRRTSNKCHPEISSHTARKVLKEVFPF